MLAGYREKRGRGKETIGESSKRCASEGLDLTTFVAARQAEHERSARVERPRKGCVYVLSGAVACVRK